MHPHLILLHFLDPIFIHAFLLVMIFEFSVCPFLFLPKILSYCILLSPMMVLPGWAGGSRIYNPSTDFFPQVLNEWFPLAWYITTSTLHGFHQHYSSRKIIDSKSLLFLLYFLSQHISKQTNKKPKVNLKSSL